MFIGLTITRGIRNVKNNASEGGKVLHMRTAPEGTRKIYRKIAGDLVEIQTWHTLKFRCCITLPIFQIHESNNMLYESAYSNFQKALTPESV